MLNGIALAGKDLEKHLDALSLRQRLTASNIANVDTPGYRTKDIVFQDALASALEELPTPQVVEVDGLLIKNDGNNVSLDREAQALSETALRFNFVAQLLKGELEDIRKAIRSDA